MKKLLALALIALVIWNAYRIPGGSAYFHPASDESQRYSVKMTAGTYLSVEGGATVRNENAVDIDGNEYQKLVINFDGIPGMENQTSYSRLSKEGIFTRTSTKVRIPEYMELPLPPEVGRKWRYEVNGHTAESEIVAIESVATPDKVYHQCVKVHSKGTINGRQAESITYYAPRAGRVKTTLTFSYATVEMTLREE
jgi:hypothetical protein